jgi:hypothetical protein
MALGKKISSALRDLFCRAVYFESADDRDRKVEVAGQLIAFSAPFAGEGGADYDRRLQAVLMEVRTKFLDTLLEKEVAIALDPRLSQQKLDEKDYAVEGMFYAGPKEGAKGGLTTFSGEWVTREQQRRSGVLLEKLAEVLREGTPKVDLYAWTSFTIAMGGEGMAYPVCISSWSCEGGGDTALSKNPALRQPPSKFAGGPRPG